MGKEIIVTSLEQWCDLLCGQPEEDEDMLPAEMLGAGKESFKKVSRKFKESLKEEEK